MARPEEETSPAAPAVSAEEVETMMGSAMRNVFTCGGALRSISGTFSFLLLKTSQNSHLKASNTETAQSRREWMKIFTF